MAGPDIVTRGFVYVRDSEEMIDEVKQIVRDTLLLCQEEGIYQWAALKNRIKEMVGKRLFEMTGRKPMIIPIIQEIKTI